MNLRPFAVLALLAAPALAQEAPRPTMLTIEAEGRAVRAPDLVELSGGVLTSAKTAAAAMAENATRMSAVVAAVRKAGVAERDIQTQGLNLQPQYRYDQNQPPVLTGYQASNTVALRLRKLPDAGRLLDTLVSVGANQINGPTFAVDDIDSALDEARVAAVAKARARALLYAKAAGLQLGRIVTISEVSGSAPQPPMPQQMRAMKASADSTPVVPGEIALTVNVTMTFELR